MYSYTTIHHASDERLRDAVPYVAAVLTFPDLEGVRFVSNIVNVDPARLYVGMPVALTWHYLDCGQWLPRFEPSKDKANVDE